MNCRAFKLIAPVVLLALWSSAARGADDPIPEPTQNPAAIFRLFRTQNIYTFLRLDTRSGQLWQVQWGIGDENRLARTINETPLANDGKPGRFTLYPTENIYNFMLLDQDTGLVWQVQWSLEAKQRLIILIG